MAASRRLWWLLSLALAASIVGALAMVTPIFRPGIVPKIPEATTSCPFIVASSPATLSTRPIHPLNPCPGVIMGTYLGGTLADIANDVAVDAAGNAYVVGYTNSTDFPTTPGALNPTDDPDCSELTYICGDDGFLVGIRPNGLIIFSTLLGGSSRDRAYSVAVDSMGNAYVTGTTLSVDFPTTYKAYDRTPTRGDGDYDAFVMKFNSAGDLVYSTLLGGGGLDQGYSIAVDASGNAYVTGLTTSPDFPISDGAFVSPGSEADVFVARLNPSGTALDYSTVIGGSQWEYNAEIAIDPAGSAYVTGWTDSSDFPITADAFDTTFSGEDTFIFKLNPEASELEYATMLGGSRRDRPEAIAVDASGTAYVIGWTNSVDFPTTPRAFDTDMSYPYGVCDDVEAFLTGVNSSGRELVYSTFLGGTCEDFGNGVYVDKSGIVYVTGQTKSWGFPGNFPTTPGAYDSTYNGGSDAFVAKLDLEEGFLNYSTFLGGGDEVWPRDTGLDIGRSLAIDPTGNATVVGMTTSLDFPTTEGTPNVAYQGGSSDAFVVRIELVPEPNRPPVAYFEAQPSQEDAGRVVVNASNSADATDADGLLEVRWDWEDNGEWTEWSTVKDAAHTYACTSAHTIRLEVRDTEGLANETSQKVDITGGPSSCPILDAQDGPLPLWMTSIATAAIAGGTATVSGQSRNRRPRL